MTVRKVRSENAELNEGATDGKYRKRRPNTTVAAGMGDQKVVQNRAGQIKILILLKMLINQEKL